MSIIYKRNFVDLALIVFNAPMSVIYKRNFVDLALIVFNVISNSVIIIEY